MEEKNLQVVTDNHSFIHQIWWLKRWWQHLTYFRLIVQHIISIWCWRLLQRCQVQDHDLSI